MLTIHAGACTLSGMRGSALALGIWVIAWSASASGAGPAQGDPASPSGTPGANQIQFAAHEHDLGYRAYVDKRYDEAATHFENAFFAAPNQAELRSAIRARRDAGQLARAATLAAIGLRKFAGDPVTARLADEIIAQARLEAYEVHIVSRAECSVVIDEKIVIAGKVKDFRVFVSPGKHELLVSWSDDSSERVSIEGIAGASQTLTLEPPAAAPPSQPLPVTEPISPPAASPLPPLSEPASTRPFGPLVFVSSAVITVALAGVTIWSGIDAKNNPGPDTVKRVCVGRGDSCLAFQEGLDAQRRTNILLATTGGFALATTIVGVAFTQWLHIDRAPTRGAIVVPILGFGQVALHGTF